MLYAQTLKQWQKAKQTLGEELQDILGVHLDDRTPKTNL